MAYSILDVPSTGNARFSQSRFLKYRQLPLLIASLVLTEWWALFRNIHGDTPFKPRDVLWKFIAFAVASYLAGGCLPRRSRLHLAQAGTSKSSRRRKIDGAGCFSLLATLALKQFAGHPLQRDP